MEIDALIIDLNRPRWDAIKRGPREKPVKEMPLKSSGAAPKTPRKPLSIEVLPKAP